MKNTIILELSSLHLTQNMDIFKNKMKVKLISFKLYEVILN